MNYRDFYKIEQALAGFRPLAETLNTSKIPPQLLKGAEVELEHTPSRGKKLQDAAPRDIKKAMVTAKDHLAEDPKYYDKLKQAGLEECDVSECGPISFGGYEPMQPVTALDVPSRIRPVSIVNLVSPATAFSKPSTTGVKQPGDKEPITAGGHEINPQSAAKSVGGPVVPNKGQEQGGPNTTGNIAGTPKDLSTKSECSGPNTKGSVGGTPKNPSLGLKGSDLLKGGIGVSTTQSHLGQFEKKEHPLAKYVDGDDADSTDTIAVEPEKRGVNVYDQLKEKDDEEKDPDGYEAANRREMDSMSGSDYEKPEDEEGENVTIKLQESLKKLLREVISEVISEEFSEEDVLKGVEKELSAVKEKGVKDISPHAEDLAKQIAKFHLKKNPKHYEVDEASESQITMLDDIAREVLKKAKNIRGGDVKPEVIEKVVTAMFHHQYGRKPDPDAVRAAIERNTGMVETDDKDAPKEGPYVKNCKCTGCGKTFTPEWGEFSRCPDCLGKQHSDAEKDNTVDEAGIKDLLDVNKLSDIEVDGVDSRDYPHFSDAYVTSAVYPLVDEPEGPEDWRELTDTELDWLNDKHPEVANQAAHGKVQSAGDFAADAAKDRAMGLEETSKMGPKGLGKKETPKFNTNPKKLKNPSTKAISKLQKEAAFISRKINEGRELTEDEKKLIQEIILTRAIHIKEELEEQGWERTTEARESALDNMIHLVVRYRSKEDTADSLKSNIVAAAENKLGLKHIDDEGILRKVEDLMKRYPARY